MHKYINGIQQDMSWVIWNKYNPEDKIEHGDEYIIHHKDFDHNNNNINNLQKMTNSSHSRLHGLKRNNIPSFKGRKHSKDTLLKMSKIKKGKIFSESTKEKMSQNHSDFSGSKNPRARAVNINDQMFGSVKEASIVLNINRNIIDKQLKNNIEGYKYMEVSNE